jgi:hypothetical protein
MEEQEKIMFLNTFLLAASRSSEETFKKMVNFTQELIATTDAKADFADQAFIQYMSNICNLIKMMR